VSDDLQVSSRTVTIVELANTGPPEPFTQIIISALPDNVLLEIFNFYLDLIQSLFSSTGKRPILWYPDLWHALVHVCCRWQSVVFASPRCLNLWLLCTEKRPVKRNIWPDLLIVIDAKIPKSQRSRSQSINIIIAALKQQHNRVCQISIWGIPNSLLKKFAAIKMPFPALTHLMLQLATDENAPVILNSSGNHPHDNLGLLVIINNILQVNYIIAF